MATKRKTILEDSLGKYVKLHEGGELYVDVPPGFFGRLQTAWTVLTAGTLKIDNIELGTEEK